MARLFFFFLLFDFLFSFSVVKSVFRGSFNVETLTSSNEERLLSEVSGWLLSHQLQMLMCCLVRE
jgi:hypothetical protein